MTKGKDFKRLIRDRMIRAGQSYTKAREVLQAEASTCPRCGRQAIPTLHKGDFDKPATNEFWCDGSRGGEGCGYTWPMPKGATNG